MNYIMFVGTQRLSVASFGKFYWANVFRNTKNKKKKNDDPWRHTDIEVSKFKGFNFDLNFVINNELWRKNRNPVLEV